MPSGVAKTGLFLTTSFLCFRELNTKCEVLGWGPNSWLHNYTAPTVCGIALSLDHTQAWV